MSNDFISGYCVGSFVGIIATLIFCRMCKSFSDVNKIINEMAPNNER